MQFEVNNKTGDTLEKRMLTWDSRDMQAKVCDIDMCQDAYHYNAQSWASIHSIKRLKSSKTAHISANYHKEVLSFNEFDFPVKEKLWFSSSENTYTKYSNQEYKHSISNWLLNLPTKTKISTDGEHYITARDISYYPKQHASYPYMPYESKHFGIWRKRFSDYHTDGNIKKVEYNQKRLNADGTESDSYQFQTFNNYKRGIPQSIKRSARKGAAEGDVHTASRIVDNNGWITSITDFNGNTTGYGYDAIGRLAYVDSPNDSHNWLDTLFSWSQAEGGTPKRTEKHCRLNAAKNGCEGEVSFNREIQFDGLLRPTLTKETDNTITRYQNQSFNAYNQPLFTSYWSASATETAGVTRTYDGLQRLDSLVQTGQGTIDYDYLTGNKIKVTDAENNVTTTTYLAYGKPSYEKATKIESPEGVTTDIDVNIFGNITSIKQSGKDKDNRDISLTEYRAYNAQQQLCKIKRADTGQTVFGHNALGQITWQAEGTSGGTNTNCISNANVANKVMFTYDNLGSIRTQTYPGTGGFTRTFTYDNNGNLEKLQSGNVTSTYTYNSLNLPESEKVQLPSDSKTWNIDYQYNSLGYINRLVYPDGYGVDYAPNAFGQPTQAVRYKTGTDNVNYATGASYYPSGHIDTFTYGNGIVHKITLNTSKLPKEIKDGTLLNYTYTYDNNQNIASITDKVEAGYSLTNLSYDGLDRLKTTTGNSGIGSSSIEYDGLGNIYKYNSKGRQLTYSYPANNQLETVKSYGTTVREFTYDKRGNVTHNLYRNFTYNLANQMITSGTNRYIYDGHNRRVKTQDSKGTKYSLYGLDGTLLYSEKDNKGINYIYLGKKLIAKDGFIPENSGKQHYRPYGESIEGATDDIGYTGHKFDTDLNLSYMQARYYDPVIGRFYSNDPVGYRDVHSFNRYAYANNNPYAYTDPTGKVAFKVVKQLVKNKGDVVQTVADVGGDIVTVFSPSSTPMDRIEAAISLVSPVDVGDIKAVKGALEATGKKFGGRKGGIDTRAQNQAIGNNINANGGTTTAGFGAKETRFAGNGGGNAGSRYSDGSAVDGNGNAFQVQTVDANASGTMTTREFDAATDIASKSQQPVVCVNKTSC